jgi:hypothetical protein
MAVTAGSKLTCSHADCGCEVDVVTPCQCAGSGEYQCHCGAPLIPKG